MKYFHLLFFIAVCFFACAQKQTKRYVFDRVDLLTPSRVDSLNAEISELEKTIGSQMAIFAIDSLPGKTIEAYGGVGVLLA